MKITDFEAISFDCYGTLIDWEAGLAAVLGPWARSRGVALGDEALLAAYAGHEERAEAEDPGTLYPDILARSLTALGRDLGAEVTAEDAERLGRSVPDWPAFADSPAALAALASRYKLIILSNVDRDSFAASQRRLGVNFGSVLTAQDIGSYKPSPRNFEALLAEAGWAWARAGCCTPPRACTTTTFRPSGPDCRRRGSTGGMTGPGGEPRRRRRSTSRPTGSSRPWPPSPRPRCHRPRPEPVC